MLYKIIQSGETVRVTDKVTFTKKTEAGFFAECERADAQGFCLRNGDVWSLAGTDGYAGIPSASIEPVEDVELFAAKASSQIALAELAETESAHDLENKLALAELAETIGGTSNG
jgi:hypothetical protein